MSLFIIFCGFLTILGGMILNMYLERVVERRGGIFDYNTKDVIRKILMVFYIVINGYIYCMYFLYKAADAVDSLVHFF